MDTVSFRLPAGLIEEIRVAAGQHGVDRSAIVREALQEYLSRGRVAERPLSVGEFVDMLVTYEGSGVNDLGSRAKHHLREKMHARRRAR